MSAVTLLANGTAVEIVAAASTLAIVQNVSTGTVVIENAADPANGLLLFPKEKIVLDEAWSAAWMGKALHGVTAEIRVAQQ